MSATEVDLEVHQDPAHHYDIGVRTSGVRVFGFSVLLLGWALTETTGSATAAADIYDADAASGLVAFPVRLASGESAEAWYGDRGVVFRNGVYLNVTTGSVQGTLLYRHLR